LIEVTSIQRDQQTRLLDKVQPSSRVERFFDIHHDDALLLVLEEHPLDSIVERNGTPERWKEVFLFHPLMALDSDKPDEFDNLLRITEFDWLPSLQCLNDRIKNIQSPSKNNVVLHHKFYTLHDCYPVSKNMQTL
jgi:hypothetical protein